MGLFPDSAELAAVVRHLVGQILSGYFKYLVQPLATTGRFVQFFSSKTGQLNSGMCTGICMDTLNKQLLVSLFRMAQADLDASVQALASEHSVSRRDVADGLSELATLGLVRAETVRLTFTGLLHAVGLDKASRAARAPSAAA